MIAAVHQSMREFAIRLVPRMLTQVCRDPRCASYGSFDRDWWHYKIRDFSSIILQQGGYTVWTAAEAGVAPVEVKQLSAAACRFWNARAQRHGAFEEYYPWEQGYPPLAFSTLAIAKLVDAGALLLAEVRAGISIAAKQLGNRFEGQAANQQVAGLAALAWIRRIAPDLVDDESLTQLRARTLALQTEEGWLAEYGGPDLGYLSVTIDCLWDLYDATGDEQYVAVATKALGFLAAFVAMPSRGAGMHNARNTDYIVPYGVSRFLMREGEDAGLAAYVIERTWGDLDRGTHFAHAIDDRYWCHYTGHSLMRAIAVLSKANEAALSGPQFTRRDFRASGQVLVKGQTPEALSLMVSLEKGGIFSAWKGEAALADFGWVISCGKQRWVTHWWPNGKASDIALDRLTVEGSAVSYHDTLSTPVKHMGLRLASLLAGRGVIASLKRRMIFHGKASPITFRREITWSESGIEVMDSFTGLPDAYCITRAPRSSVRHVASADSFHAEDLSLLRGWTRQEDLRQSAGTCTIRTSYVPEGLTGK